MALLVEGREHAGTWRMPPQALGQAARMHILAAEGTALLQCRLGAGARFVCKSSVYGWRHCAGKLRRWLTQDVRLRPGCD